MESEDFDFYKKIDVPPPTLCPDCRQQRRYAWRNERVLYRRDCDLCRKNVVTIYSSNKPYKIYCTLCFWSDKWDGTDYGRDFDFSKNFFEQFYELQLRVPRIALLSKNSVNADYTHHSSDNKNCYLCFGTFDSENILYSTNMWGGIKKDSSDCYHVLGIAERVYELVDSERCYGCQYGVRLRDCTDCLYCFDCRNCSNCFLSSNLRGRQHYFLNKPYSKEDYEKKVKEYKLTSQQTRDGLYKQWLDLVKNGIHRFAVIEKSADVSGNMIINSKNSHFVFDADNVEDVKYATLCTDMKDSMDFYHVGFGCELIYEGHGMTYDYDCRFVHFSYNNARLTYCDDCHNGEDLFGCVGVKQGKFCILNKRYSEDEYRVLRNKIIAHMKKTKEFGEFFPARFSPFGYNETQGNVYMPLSKEEAITRGYRWEDRVPGTFGKETLRLEEIPDDIGEVSDDILKEALVCANCRKNYNILRPELVFYRRESLPIPRLCPDCRYMRRLKLRPPRNLWHRRCMKPGCQNKFETPYAPERPEIVYCETCYNAEIA